MKKLTRFLFLALLQCTFLLQSCNKQPAETEAQNHPDHLPLATGIQYLKNNVPQPQDFSGGESMRVIDTAKRFVYTDADVDWGNMRSIDLADGSNILVTNARMQQPCQLYSRLAMAQHNSTIYTYIYELIADDSVLNAHQQDAAFLQKFYNLRNFSGILNTYDVKGILLNVRKIVEGMVTEQVNTAACTSCAMAVGMPAGPSLPICTEFWWMCNQGSGGGGYPDTPMTQILNGPCFGPGVGGGNGVPLITQLQNLLGLNAQQVNWLNNHHDYLILINNQLNENQRSEEAKTVARIMIDLGVNNLIDGPWGTQFEQTAQPHLREYYDQVYHQIMMYQWSSENIMNYVIARQEHPDWSRIRCFWEAIQESVHNALDLAGLIPVAGEICDLTNGVIYTIQGDGMNATLSYAAALPITGWAATGYKWVKKTVTALDGTKRTLKWVKLNNTVIDFGNRSLLRKVLGLPVGDPRAAHHIIPWEKASHPIIQKAAQGTNAFHLNEILNGIPLSQAAHSGNHSVYLQKVQDRLDQISTTLSPDATRVEVEKIIADIRAQIQAHPNTNIDQLNF